MANTFSIGSNSPGPKDSGLGFKIMVRICGLIAIGGFFLPYIAERSGLDMIQHIQMRMDLMGFGETISSLFSAKTVGASILNGLLIFSYILFPLIGLLMLLRGKYSGGPFTIILFFNIAIFVLFKLFAVEAEIEVGFFSLLNVGYWVSVGGLFLPFVGMFFLDKSV